MKTAISIPDPLFQVAEQFAQAKGLSRSELYVRAIQFYLQTHQSDAITTALNQVYDQASSQLEPGFMLAQAHIVAKEDW
ncbi:MAG: hypothetical protein WCF99_04900 [Chloroflexales bacterium]